MKHGTSAPAPAVRLVPLAVAHLPYVMTWVNDHEVLQYFANRQQDISEDDERRYLASLVESRNDRAWSIFAGGPGDPESDATYLGQCSVNQIYWPARNGRVFIALRRSAQGRGLGSAGLARLLERAWAELDLHKLWLIVRKDNRAAQSLYLRLGFDFEGVLRDEYCVAGRFYDMVRMGALRPSSVPASGDRSARP